MVTITLKSVMVRQKMTIRDLAKLSGVSKSEICYILSGKTIPRLDTLWFLAKALGVKIEELYTYE